jgi:hypothetical protein
MNIQHIDTTNRHLKIIYILIAIGSVLLGSLTGVDVR